MRILILTQYFPPETGAPQNRLFELAVRLRKHGDEVTVLTAMPNYPVMRIHNGYRGKWTMEEEMHGLKVMRCWIYVSKSKSIVARLLNYFSFVFSSFFIGWSRIPKQDLIICESPPLFLGISALLLKKLKNAKMLFNVSDLWPESAEKLGLVTNKTILLLTYKLELFIYRHSELISGQTRGIVKNIEERTGKKVYWLPNGVDHGIFDPSLDPLFFRKRYGFDAEDFILLYAGIIGHAQGLEVILKAADLVKNEKNIKFILLGSGPEKIRLEEMKLKQELNNVYFIDAIPKSEMPYAVAASSASVIPLKRLELFKGAIPSKIFESQAMRKPILLGVEGEAKELFIDRGNGGLAFTPEDEKDLAEKIMTIFKDRLLCEKLGNNGREFILKNFSRDLIAEEFRNYLLAN